VISFTMSVFYHGKPGKFPVIFSLSNNHQCQIANINVFSVVCDSVQTWTQGLKYNPQILSTFKMNCDEHRSFWWSLNSSKLFW
jgi:hypothetical protein